MKNINVIRSYKPVKDIQDILDYIYGIILEKIEISLLKSEKAQYNWVKYYSYKNDFRYS